MRMLNDTELLQRTAQARGKAHRAPFAEWSKDHLGHSAIVRHTDAWTVRSDEFVTLLSECHRRGLVIPSCDCPEGAHDPH